MAVMNLRVMAVDYGDARTGIAVVRRVRLIAGEAFTINEWNAERLSEEIAEAASARGRKRSCSEPAEYGRAGAGHGPRKARRFQKSA
jgi:hypothetical protein